MNRVSQDHERSGSSVTSGQTPSPRAADSLLQLAWEVRVLARFGGVPDQSERDAMAELADRAELLLERLQAIFDWADFAMRNPQTFDGHGVRNLDGPIFDYGREVVAKAEGQPSSAKPAVGDSSRDTDTLPDSFLQASSTKEDGHG